MVNIGRRLDALGMRDRPLFSTARWPFQRGEFTAQSALACHIRLWFSLAHLIPELTRTKGTRAPIFVESFRLSRARANFIRRCRSARHVPVICAFSSKRRKPRAHYRRVNPVCGATRRAFTGFNYMTALSRWSHFEKSESGGSGQLRDCENRVFHRAASARARNKGTIA